MDNQFFEAMINIVSDTSSQNPEDYATQRRQLAVVDTMTRAASITKWPDEDTRRQALEKIGQLSDSVEARFVTTRKT